MTHIDNLRCAFHWHSDLHESTLDFTWLYKPTLPAATVSFRGCWQPLQVMKRGKMTATLHLCLEARQETLRYYHLYKGSAAKFVAPKISFTQCGYINPNLDIIHLAVPFGSGPAKGHIQIERLSPATLRLTLGHALVPSAVLKWFAEKPQLFAGLETINFWVWTPSRMFENGVTERYRICRVPHSTPLLRGFIEKTSFIS